MFLTPDTTGKHALWRYFSVTLLTLGAAVGTQMATLPLLFYMGRNYGLDRAMVLEKLTQGDLEAIGLSLTSAFALGLLTFVAALSALLLGVRWLHKRAPLSILTTRARFDVSRVAVGAGLWFFLAGGGILLVIPQEKLTLQFDLATFMPLALVACFLIPVQVLAEEALFRGYWMQGLARVVKSPLAALLISSVLFMSMHLSNPELAQDMARVLPVYFCLGVFFATLAILDDGLELGTGCHLGNNIFVSVVLSSSNGAVTTPSIFQAETETIISGMWILIVVVPLATALLSWRYTFNWRKLIRTDVVGQSTA